jgi:hypothetical protein
MYTYLKTIYGVRYGSTPYNPSSQEAKAGGSQVQGQPWLHSKTLSQKQYGMPDKYIISVINFLN